jgi:tetratricopeptide (TPR) repeat protein
MTRRSRSREYQLADRPPVRLSLIFLTLILFLLGAAVVGAIVFPQDTAFFFRELTGSNPVVHSLEVEIRGIKTELRPGAKIDLQPNDTLAVLSISSNRPFNYNLRLYSPELDVFIFKEPIVFARVFSEESFIQPKKLVIQVKEGSMVLANFTFSIRHSAFTLVKKAERVKDNKEKMTLFHQALIIEPDDLSIMRKLADVLLEEEKYQEAAVQYEEMHRREPSLDNLRKLLNIYQAAMDYRKVVGTYHRLIEVSSESDARHYLYLLGQFQEELNQAAGAIETYRVLKDRLPAGQRVDILKKLGFMYAQADEIPKSIESYEEAGRIDTADPNIFQNLARLYQTIDDKEGYKNSLVRILKANPTDRETRYKLAELHAGAEEYEAAEMELRRLLAIDPDNLEVRFKLINILEKSRQPEAQIEEYEFLLDKVENSSVVRFNLSVLYFEAGKYERARKHLEELVRLDPQDKEARQYLFEVYVRQEKEDEAYNLAKELTRLSPDFEPPYHFMFDYLDRKEYYRTLANLAEEWVKNLPRSVRLWEYLAYAHIKQDMLKRAAKDYETILSITPDDASALFKLARLYEAVDRPSDAMQMYGRVLEIEPEHEQAAQAHLRLSLKRLESKQLK